MNDILETAGVGRNGQDDTDEFDHDIDIDFDLDVDEYDDMDPNSPSVVRKAVGLEDETF